LGDGVFPAHEYLGAGGACGIGTDSNVLIDAAEELRTLEYTQRLAHRRRNVLASDLEHSTGRRLLQTMLAGGAQALGVDRRGLVAGADADIVSLDTTHDSLLNRHADALLDSWVFAARASAIDCVWRFGRKVVVGGRHIRRDAIAARYRRVLAGLLSA
jgi:cytosine/adenosine deaminase-related metal-dependent hydrolase